MTESLLQAVDISGPELDANLVFHVTGYFGAGVSPGAKRPYAAGGGGRA